MKKKDTIKGTSKALGVRQKVKADGLVVSPPEFPILTFPKMPIAQIRTF